MKNKITNFLKIAFVTGSFLGFVLVAGATGTWSSPAGAPPDGNVDAPINVGSTSQIKTGPLSISNLFAVGSSSGLVCYFVPTTSGCSTSARGDSTTDSFHVAGNSSFDGTSNFYNTSNLKDTNVQGNLITTIINPFTSSFKVMQTGFTTPLAWITGNSGGNGSLTMGGNNSYIQGEEIVVDPNGVNDGTAPTTTSTSNTHSIRFGSMGGSMGGSGESISSRRTTSTGTGNINGLDFWTNGINRMSIANNGHVDIHGDTRVFGSTGTGFAFRVIGDTSTGNLGVGGDLNVTASATMPGVSIAADGTSQTMSHLIISDGIPVYVAVNCDDSGEGNRVPVGTLTTYSNNCDGGGGSTGNSLAGYLVHP